MTGESTTGGRERGSAEYVFGVTVRLDPDRGDLTVDPTTVEATLSRGADPPGEEGWLFFRDNLWKGELADPAYFQELTAEALGVEVEAVDFRELRTSQQYLDGLKAAIRDDLALFNADSTTEVLSKYLGSSIHVVSG